MKRSRFFSAVWRINAILICLCGLIGTTALAFGLYMLVRESSRTQHAQNVMRVSDQEIDTTKVVLSRFESIEGTPVLRATLWRTQEYGFRSGLKEARSAQNVLLFDSASGRARWLLPGFKGIILETYRLPDERHSESSKPIQGFAYEIVEVDSDGDGKLTSGDLKDIYLSNPDGASMHVAINSVEDFNGAHSMADTSEAFLFYTKKGQYRVAKADLRSGTVISDTELGIEKGEARP